MVGSNDGLPSPVEEVISSPYDGAVASTYAHVTPSVLRWARESIGMETHEVAGELGLHTWQIETAEKGIELLTLRQAERLAKLYDRPLATLFMPEPPDEDPPETQFRRLPGAPALPWPAAMHKLARRIRERQYAAVELMDLLDDETSWGRVAERFRGQSPGALAATARELLGISVDEQTSWSDSSGYLPLRSWVDAIERLGILVMQDGSMTPEEMRGFAAFHDQAPAIVANTKDDPRARTFTVVHELGHLAWAASGARGPGDEAWCNRFAGEVLMPESEFSEAFARLRLPPDARVTSLALLFGVTPLAAAVRIASLGLLPSAAGQDLVESIRSRPAPERSPGGNFYLNKVSWLGPAFIRLVLEAVDEQALTLSNAAGLLGVKVSQFDRLRTTVETRTAMG